MEKLENGNAIVQKISSLVLLVSICMIGALFLPPTAEAKWRYMSMEEMISGADAIAVVVINKIERSDAKSADDGFSDMTSYHQQGSATVEQLLKGKLPKDITIYAGYGMRNGNAICAPTNSLELGRSIVFLHHNGDLLVPMNGELGIRPISNNQIKNWYGKGVFNASGVINAIKKQLQPAQTNIQSKK